MAVADPGATRTQLATAANAALTRLPAAEALTRDQFKDNAARLRSTSCSGLVYGLLLLSVIVALLGIVNTLALSVHERTRELGHAARGRHEPRARCAGWSAPSR